MNRDTLMKASEKPVVIPRDDVASVGGDLLTSGFVSIASTLPVAPATGCTLTPFGAMPRAALPPGIRTIAVDADGKYVDLTGIADRIRAVFQLHHK
jgi:hypothetical protein